MLVVDDMLCNVLCVRQEQEHYRQGLVVEVMSEMCCV